LHTLWRSGVGVCGRYENGSAMFVDRCGVSPLQHASHVRCLGDINTSQTDSLFRRVLVGVFVFVFFCVVSIAQVCGGYSRCPMQSDDVIAIGDLKLVIFFVFVADRFD
jgi:hypothetical protein